MALMNHRNQSASSAHFAMIPQPNIPRSAMVQQHTHKTTFDAGYVVPHYIREVLPGDSIKMRHTIFSRMSTPIFPVMDNLYQDTFYFFCGNRLVWDNFVRMMGEQDNPGDSISYVVPQQVSPVGGYAVGSVQDYMGLPTVGQLGGANTKSHSALPLRMYNLIWNEWFRDENLQNAAFETRGDGPDPTPSTNFILRRRGKRKDYFTGALPWPQKGSTGVSIPLGGTAPVLGLYQGNNSSVTTVFGSTQQIGNAAAGATSLSGQSLFAASKSAVGTAPATAFNATNADVYADLSAAGGVLINQLRQSIMIQELLEIDARGGTRYTEVNRAHFGVASPDMRLQRPEYIGGDSVRINFNPIAQTGQTGITGGTTPMGTLSGMATALAQGNGFNYSATEHGYIIGFINVRADLTYQQGIHRHWTRSTRYDFYWPALAHLGEQAIRNDEIYCDGSANDVLTFGYQEAWAPYRYMPNRISGLFKSTSAGTIDGWHLAQKFTALPTLNDTFIQDTPPLSRVLAVGASANGQQIISDMFFDETVVRAMPMYSVPHISSYL